MWELNYKESWAPQNWCFWTLMLEKTLESPLDCKEIQPIPPKEDQSWVFIGRTDVEVETPILWPPDANWLIWKDADSRKDWRWKKKGTTENEMVGWHHSLNGLVIFIFLKSEWRVDLSWNFTSIGNLWKALSLSLFLVRQWNTLSKCLGSSGAYLWHRKIWKIVEKYFK